MSLIITSSKQDRYLGNNAIESPWSYKNYLGNPSVIPPHSEVAVQSVKIHRAPVFRFGDKNKQAFVMLGAAIDTKDGNLPINRPTTMLPVIITEGVYTAELLAKELTSAFTNAYCAHPDAATPEISLKRLLGIFTGFNFKFSQKTIASQVDVGGAGAKPDTWYPRPLLGNDQRDLGTGKHGMPSFYRNKANDEDDITANQFHDKTFVPDWWDNGTKTITNVVPSAGFGVAGDHFSGGIFPQFPMSHANGLFKFDVSAALDCEWFVGLTRPVACGTAVPLNNGYDNGEGMINLYGNGGASNAAPPWAETKKSNQVWKFGDFVARSQLAADGKHYLRIFYFGFKNASQVDGLGTGNDLKPTMPLHYFNEADDPSSGTIDPVAEVAYWQPATTDYGGSASKNKMYDLGANTLAIKYFQFQLANERMEFAGVKDDGTVIKFCAYHQDNDFGFPSAGSPNRFTLYPKVLIADGAAATKKIVLTKFDCRTDMVATHAGSKSEWSYGEDMATRTQNQRVAEDVDRRPMNDPVWMSASNLEGTAPIGCEAGAGLNKDLLEYIPYIMFSNDSRISPTFVKYPYANMGNICGLPDTTYVGGGTAAADLAGGGAFDDDTKALTFGSLHIPKIEAEHSLFIRCPTLTQMSQNFSKGSVSKMLYHIPQFTPDGRTTGALFFEPHEKTYLKLGNTEKLDLNELQIDVVDKNENLAYELEGTTVVCLHIR